MRFGEFIAVMPRNPGRIWLRQCYHWKLCKFAVVHCAIEQREPAGIDHILCIVKNHHADPLTRVLFPFLHGAEKMVKAVRLARGAFDIA